MFAEKEEMGLTVAFGRSIPDGLKKLAFLGVCHIIFSI